MLLPFFAYALPERTATGFVTLSRVDQMCARTTLLLLSLGLGLAGCSQKSDDDSQVIASGQQFEVTVPELEQILRGAPSVSRDAVLPARKAILNSLVDRKLLAQAALDAHLDRQPSVVQSLEADKRDILARAYAQQVAGSPVTPSGTDVQAYYDQHPILFAGRKRYEIEEVSVPADSPNLPHYVQVLDRDGLDALKTALSADGITVAVQPIAITSEYFSGAADKLDKLVPGRTVTFRGNGKAYLGRIKAIEPAALPLDQVRDMIVERIQNERRDVLVKAEVGRLRAARQIHVNEAKLGTPPSKQTQ